MKRCEECGSWGEECGSPMPVADCSCARCVVTAHQREYERAEALAVELSHAVQERDEARAEVATVLAERDAAVSVGTQLERERDRYREKAEALEDRCSIAEGDLYRVKVERDEARAERDAHAAETLRLRWNSDETAMQAIKDLDEARREGAEAMREAAALACRPMLRDMVSRSTLAREIRALPLPGDKP